MSSFGGSIGHEKKLETAKEKKEQADKAFQASDVPTGAFGLLLFFWVGRGGLVFSTLFGSFEVLS